MISNNATEGKLVHVGLYETAAHAPVRVTQPLFQQFRSDDRVRSAYALQYPQDIACSAAHLQDPVPGRERRHQRSHHFTDHTIAGGEPEMPVLGSDERRTFGGLWPPGSDSLDFGSDGHASP
jgi:hypothetical protein